MSKIQLPVPPGILVSGGAALAGLFAGGLLFLILSLLNMIPW